MDTKLCKKCGIERDRDLFNKKGTSCSPGRRVSTCRLCQSTSGIVYSFYNYPTKEMDQIARKNSVILNRKLRNKAITISKKTARFKLCTRCNVENVPFKKQICIPCRKKEDQRRQKERDKKQITLIKEKYIKHLLRASLKEYEISSYDIPQDLIELKRKQILLIRKLRNHEENKDSINQ
jgi:hypothetical protein